MLAMSAKRKASETGTSTLPSGDDFVFTPLGSGREVGRSCHILRFKGKTIMLDCGVHPGYEGMDSLPFLEEVDLSEVDIILISHYHLDHVAALPYLLKNKDVFKGRVYMTHPTKSIYKALLQDFVRVTNASGRDTLYSAEDVADTMSLIEAINFHQVITYRGVRFWAYHAGHVLGAAMFMIEIDGIRFLYTGDYSRSEDRHLVAAEVPPTRPDVLIVEATHGTQQHEPVAFRENRFLQFVYQVVLRGGKCLIPQFALGRAQELLLVLEEFWEANPSLHSVPIYYMSALAKKCLKDYQTYTYMMNARVQARAQSRNPFRFRHIINIPLLSRFEGIENGPGPCVVMASPGMLQNGWSRRLFDSWCEDAKNGLMLAGYSVENTLAHTIQTAPPTQITTQEGFKKDLLMSVGVVPFTAHADFVETSAFVDQLRPRYVIFVHGNKKEMTSLEKRLTAKYSTGDTSIEFFSPENSQNVALSFVKRRMVRMVGGIVHGAVEEMTTDIGSSIEHDTHDHDHAHDQEGVFTGGEEPNTSMIDDQTPEPIDSQVDTTTVAEKSKSSGLNVKDGVTVSGLFVRHNYNYTFLSAEDLPNYTHIKSATVRQRISVPFYQSFDLAKIVISQMYDTEELIQVVVPPTMTTGSGVKKEEVKIGENNETHEDEDHAEALAAISTMKAENATSSVTKAEAEAPAFTPPIPVSAVDSKTGASTSSTSTSTSTSTSIAVRSLLVQGCVRLSSVQGQRGLSMSWICGSLADMVSDSLVALLMAAEANPVVARMLGDGMGSCGGHSHDDHEHEHDDKHNETEKSEKSEKSEKDEKDEKNEKSKKSKNQEKQTPSPPTQLLSESAIISTAEQLTSIPPVKVLVHDPTSSSPSYLASPDIEKRYNWTPSELREMAWFMFLKYGGSYRLCPYTTTTTRNASTVNANADVVSFKSDPIQFATLSNSTTNPTMDTMDDKMIEERDHESKTNSLNSPNSSMGWVLDLENLSSTTESSVTPGLYAPVIAFNTESCCGEVETSTLRVFVHHRYTDRAPETLLSQLKQKLSSETIDTNGRIISSSSPLLPVPGSLLSDEEVLALVRSMELTLDQFYSSVKPLKTGPANIYSKQDEEEGGLLLAPEEALAQTGVVTGTSGTVGGGVVGSVVGGSGITPGRDALRRKTKAAMAMGQRGGKVLSDSEASSPDTDEEGKTHGGDETREPDTISGGFSSEDDDAAY